MLQEVNGTIQEMHGNATNAMTITGGGGSSSQLTVGSYGVWDGGYYWPYQTQWFSYPVYVCTDKTKKAIEVLKALQAEKILKCDSVPRFIALVEKISALL